MLLRKRNGNRFFQYKDFRKAGLCYASGVKLAESGLGATESPDELLLQAYIDCMNNLAACYVSRGEYFKAKEICIQLLELCPSNIKGLLRAARASLALHDYEETELCLSRVLEIEPENVTAKDEFIRLHKAKKEYNLKENAIAKKISQGLFSPLLKSNSSSACPTVRPPSEEVEVSASSTPTSTPTKSVDSIPVNSQSKFIGNMSSEKDLLSVNTSIQDNDWKSNSTFSYVKSGFLSFSVTIVFVAIFLYYFDLAGVIP